jgi:hypothetical protein
MLTLPLEKMTTTELEARVAYHEGNAQFFERGKEPGIAQQFRLLADKYRRELAKREYDPETEARR